MPVRLRHNPPYRDVVTLNRMKRITESLRIDRWLYYCRFYRSRGQATAAVSGGHVRLNGERPSPGSRVKCGDRVDLVRDRLAYSLTVTGIPQRRGPATEASGCYVEDPGSAREREARVALLRQDRLLMPRTDGRPDKRTRRQLIDRKGS
jgi:ribosome-associated heat shock protein Hsp15